MVAGISLESGFELFYLHNCAIDSDSFCDFIDDLATLNKGKDVAIVMDNLRVHKHQSVKELLAIHNVESIFTVPYTPDFNAIELPFS